MIQFALAIFGLSAIFMAMGHNITARKWAPIVGLCGQPFWLTFAYQTHAVGVAILSIAYTIVYLIGARNQWKNNHGTPQQTD